MHALPSSPLGKLLSTEVSAAVATTPDRSADEIQGELTPWRQTWLDVAVVAAAIGRMVRRSCARCRLEWFVQDPPALFGDGDVEARRPERMLRVRAVVPDDEKPGRSE